MPFEFWLFCTLCASVLSATKESDWGARLDKFEEEMKKMQKKMSFIDSSLISARKELTQHDKMQKELTFINSGLDKMQKRLTFINSKYDKMQKELTFIKSMNDKMRKELISRHKELLSKLADLDAKYNQNTAIHTSLKKAGGTSLLVARYAPYIHHFNHGCGELFRWCERGWRWTQGEFPWKRGAFIAPPTLDFADGFLRGRVNEKQNKLVSSLDVFRNVIFDLLSNQSDSFYKNWSVQSPRTLFIPRLKSLK